MDYSKRIVLALGLVGLFFIVWSILFSFKISVLLSITLLMVVFVLATQKRLYPFPSHIGLGGLVAWVVALYQHVGDKGYLFSSGEFSFFVTLLLISFILIALDGAHYFNEYQKAPILGKSPLFSKSSHKIH